MAGVIVTYIGSDGKRYFLTGKESVYLTDTTATVRLDGRERDLRDDLQKSAPNVAEGQAKADFENRAKRLSTAIGQRVQFAQPVLEGTRWTTTYRILPGSFKYGIPKGRAEGTETPLQTANRELGEEVGIQIAGLVEFPVPGIDRVIFKKDIKETDATRMMQTIAGRMSRQYGELFDVGFRTADDLAGKTNFITTQSIRQVGGRRRRRRTIRRSRRRITRRT